MIECAFGANIPCASPRVADSAYRSAILNSMAVEYDDVVQWALELPDVEEALSHGKPCVKRAGRMMFAPSREEGALTFKLDWETHDRLLEEKPKVYFKTPHYEGWPWILARMSKLTEKEARMLIKVSWEDAPKPAKVRKK